MEHLMFIEATRDLSTALVVHYNLFFVLFSILIAIFASYTAFLVAERIAYYKKQLQKVSWIIAGGLTLAAGVWAMHFIGMLAAELSVRVNYDLIITLVSLIPVFLASLVVLFNGLKSESIQKQLLIRSVAIGAGIGLMHYIGMMAMRMDAIMRYDPIIMLISVVAAVALAYIALKVKLWAEEGDHGELTKHPRLVAATIMGASISGMHYIGMASVYFFPSDEVNVIEPGINSVALAQIILAVVLSLIGLLIFMVFLSRRLDLINKLRTSEGKMKAILDHVGEAIITIDSKGIIQNYNDGAVKIFGYSENEAIGSNIKIIVPEPHHSQHDNYLSNYASTGIKKIMGATRTVEGRHKDGTLMTVELRVTELIIDNKVMFTGLVRDVTEKVKAEAELKRYREHLEVLVGERTRELQDARDEALEATKTKSEFLANMSHELRTPLNSIIGFSGIVKDGIAGPVNDEQAKQLNMVYNSARHLLDLINDILDLSKVEAGKMEVIKEDVDFYEMVNDVTDLLQPQVKSKDLELNVLLNDAPEMFYTDAKMIRQVLLNLLSNAVKFITEGEVSLTCSVFKSILRIEITDTGMGIDEDDIKHVFDSFKQLDAGDNRLNEGTGLGLAICREFIELLGGHLTVKSKVGIGSTFSIDLPIETLQSNQSSRLGAAVPEPASLKSADKLILIVDDEGSSRELLNTYLKNDGFETIMCSNGLDAIAIAKEYKPFAITLDILIPDMDGWAILAELKDDSETSNIPVIIISTLDDQRLGISLGAVDYLQKPISSDAIMASLMNLTLEGSNVLVVEDHEQDALLLRNMLEPAGYHVRIENSGSAAIDAIERSIPDVILLDLMMPGMSGFEVVRRLRSQTGPASDIPIIVVSAKTLTEAEHSYLNDNVTKILVKGKFDRDSMLKQVHAAIEKLKK